MRIPRAARRAFDAVTLIVLGVVAFLARRDGLPGDGLWFDDSWVVAGAVHGNITDLMTVGIAHPAFTTLLMAVNRFGTGEMSDFGVPALLAGTAGPMLLYVALRSFGYERAVAAVVSAALVVAPIHILYSGRVKSYTFDTLWVIAIAMAVPFLARRTWRWPLAATWTVCAIFVGMWSGYCLLATALAGVILVLHPAGDRIVRIAAVAAQAVFQGAFFLVARTKTDFDSIEEVMETHFDGHMTFFWNPVDFAGEALKHLRRVAEVFPGGSGAWLTVFALAAIAGLVLASIRGPRTEQLAARYLLLLVVFAFLGALVDRFPFGPTNNEISAGGRHTLWLAPAMAVGLAALLHRIRLLTVRFDALRFGFDLAAVVAAVAIVAFSYQAADPAPFQGSGSATRFIDESMRSRDVAIVTGSSTFAYAASTSKPVKLVGTPDHQVGFAPVIQDPRVHIIGAWAVAPGTPADIRSWVLGADRVYVTAFGAVVGPGPEIVAGVLRSLGFTMQQQRLFEWSSVQVWQR